MQNREAKAASENVSETTCKGQFPSENVLHVVWERLSFVSNLANLGGAFGMVVRSSGRDCMPIC